MTQLRILGVFLVGILLINTGSLYGQNFTRVQGDISAQENFSVGSSWVDVNQDGHLDIYVTNNRYEDNSLYINNGDGTFRLDSTSIITNDSKKASTSVWADYDNDGDMDLYVSNAGQDNDLYVNQGDGQFVDKDEVVIAQDYSSITAAWGDYNNDGYIDLFVGNGFHDYENSLYRNNGNGSFTEITETPIGEIRSDTRSATWGDMDGDGDLDLFVGNVSGQKDFLYENEGNGSFTRVDSGPVTEMQRTSPSASWMDYDNDRDLDLFVAGGNQKTNLLYQNDGEGNFQRIQQGILVEEALSSSGICWADFNNDGLLDVYVAGGHGGTAETNNLYLNSGNGDFQKVTEGIAVTYSEASGGVSCGDVDRDGYMDIFVANVNGSNSLFNNESSGNNWLKVSLRGKASNASAIGSKIRILANIKGSNVWQTRNLNSQTGHRSQNSMVIHFGLADADNVESLVVEWPSGLTTERNDLAVNQHITVTEDTTTSALALKLDKVGAIPGDTAKVPVYLTLPEDSTISSFEISLNATSKLEFAGIDTSQSFVGSSGWLSSSNVKDSTIEISAAGAEQITRSGRLINIGFVVPEKSNGEYEISVHSALFNTTSQPNVVGSGVIIVPSFGDVDYNSQVQAYDASLVLQHILQDRNFTDVQKHFANVTEDTSVSALDASLILQYTTGAVDSFNYFVTE